MSTNQKQKKDPTDWTPVRVVFELHTAGWSLRELGLKHSYKSNALGTALHRRYPKGEAIIAETLGISPELIWPSRYEDGLPIGRKKRARMNGFGVAA